jgi:hypothetical protein
MTDKPPRRFLPPWRVVELSGGFAIEDANGPAVNFARLPELLQRKGDGGGQLS